ncbi:MAG: type I-E CRISPR-associated protein Cse1/CasA [Succinivibrionaceae bacterium]|nr:type I-E CRISPR-associated protein Cse1/CasA [Succinivibrionaceae bacterium]
MSNPSTYPQNRFNLIDEPWIPILGNREASLREALSHGPQGLAGHPTLKIAILKLLLAVAQAACTPKGQHEWRILSLDALSARCHAYLDAHHDEFFLFGERPFLQFPILRELGAVKRGYALLQPWAGLGGGSAPSDAQKARLLLLQSAFAPGSRQSLGQHQGPCLSPGHCKGPIPCPGAALGAHGYLHTFYKGNSLLDTIRLNLFSSHDIDMAGIFPAGLGTAPWERMPRGEEDPIAQDLMGSMMGRLIPLSRFILLDPDGAYCTEGIVHQDHLHGMSDPSVTTYRGAGGGFHAVTVSPERRPWRDLPAMLAFLSPGRPTAWCPQLQLLGERLAGTRARVRIWSGGIRVRRLNGEALVHADSDEMESELLIPIIMGQPGMGQWHRHLSEEMERLEWQSRLLTRAVLGYARGTGSHDGGTRATMAGRHFWARCEAHAQELCDACPGGNRALRESLRISFSRAAAKSYDEACPHASARGMLSWAPNRLRLMRPFLAA